MNIFLIFKEDAVSLKERLTELAQNSDSGEYRFSFTQPDDADFFLFLTHGLQHHEIIAIATHEFVKKWPGRCFLWCDNDIPYPVLPGLYASLPASDFDETLHRTIFYLSRSNNLIKSAGSSAGKFPEKYLASFQGTLSSNVRKRLFKLKFKTDRILLRQVNQVWSSFIFGRGFDDQSALVAEYAQVMQYSKFVICPKGNGVSSYRFFETLESGRVPLLISDLYVPPKLPGNMPYFLRLPENEISRTEEYLIKNEIHFSEMSRAAKRVFDQFFADSKKVQYIGEQLNDILKTSNISGFKQLAQYQRRVKRVYTVKSVTTKLKVLLGRLLARVGSVRQSFK
ncbi:MAG: exostosin family protein [Bacteroidota bacterium]